MPHLNLTKGHGSGEDVVVVDGPAGAVGSEAEVARIVRGLCDRRGPIGGTAVYFLDEDRGGEVGVRCFGADGRAADPFRHGLRVVGRLAAERRAAGDVVLDVGEVSVPVTRLPDSAEGVARVAVGMPAQAVEAVRRPMPEVHPKRAFSVVGTRLVSVVGQYDEDELAECGVRAAADVAFLMPLDAADEVFLRSFVQGAGLTDASAACVDAGRTAYTALGAVEHDRPVTVREPGGPVVAALVPRGTQWAVRLEGNATIVYRAQVDPGVLVPGATATLDLDVQFAEVMAFGELARVNSAVLEAAGVRYGAV